MKSWGKTSISPGGRTSEELAWRVIPPPWLGGRVQCIGRRGWGGVGGELLCSAASRHLAASGRPGN